MKTKQPKAATFPGEFRPTHMTKEAVESRLGESDLKRLSTNHVKAIETAHSIANLMGFAVFVIHLSGVNYLMSDMQKTYYMKSHLTATSHKVNPS